MIKRIEVQGYQSLYDVKVELGAFTVIYGETNVGKSAFYRALKGFVTAERGDDFISKGEKKVKVAFFLDDLNEPIEWIKEKDKSSRYSFKGKVWRRCNSLPDALKKIIKLDSIDVFGGSFYPNFHGQFDPLFLIFESSGKRAKLLGWLISNILLDGIQCANRERNQKSADIRGLQEFLERLKERQEVDWDSVLDSLQKLKLSGERLQKGYRVVERLSEINNLIKENEEILKSEFKWVAVEEWKNLDKLIKLLEHLKTTRKGLDEETALADEEVLMIQKMKEMKKKLDNLKEKMKFPCPKCGYEISILEIEK